MTAKFAAPTGTAIPIYVVPKGDISAAPENAQAWAANTGFEGARGKTLLVPGADGQTACALIGSGTAAAQVRSRFALGGASKSLPDGTYQLATDLDDEAANEFALAWLLSSYSFTRYAGSPASHPDLIAPKGVDAPALEAIAEGANVPKRLRRKS